MPVFCLSYDLDEDGLGDYAGLIAKLKELQGYCHAQKSVWLVATGMTPPEIRSHLKPHLGYEDKLMILAIDRPCATYRMSRPINGESSEAGTVVDWLRFWLG